MEVLKPMVFYGGFETHGIFFLSAKHMVFNGVLKPMVFYESFETVFYGGS